MAAPLGCQSLPEAGQAATVRSHRLEPWNELHIGFGCGGNSALWWPPCPPCRLQPFSPQLNKAASPGFLGAVSQPVVIPGGWPSGSWLLKVFLAAPGSAHVERCSG